MEPTWQERHLLNPRTTIKTKAITLSLASVSIPPSNPPNSALSTQHSTLESEEPAWLAEAPEPTWDGESEASTESAPQSDEPRRYIHTPDPQAVESILKGLNPQQKEAVQATDGPLLIIAGPGSGKTRVLTHRIAYLIEVGGRVAQPHLRRHLHQQGRAGEMKRRLEDLIGSPPKT